MKTIAIIRVDLSWSGMVSSVVLGCFGMATPHIELIYLNYEGHGGKKEK